MTEHDNLINELAPQMPCSRADIETVVFIFHLCGKEVNKEVVSEFILDIYSNVGREISLYLQALISTTKTQMSVTVRLPDGAVSLSSEKDFEDFSKENTSEFSEITQSPNSYPCIAFLVHIEFVSNTQTKLVYAYIYPTT